MLSSVLPVHHHRPVDPYGAAPDRRSVASGCRRCPRYRQLGRNVQKQQFDRGTPRLGTRLDEKALGVVGHGGRKEQRGAKEKGRGHLIDGPARFGFVIGGRFRAARSTRPPFDSDQSAQAGDVVRHGLDFLVVQLGGHLGHLRAVGTRSVAEHVQLRHCVVGMLT